MRIQILLNYALIISALLLSCSDEKTASKGFFGAEFKINNPLSASDINEKMGDKERMAAQVEGTIEKVCKMSQCWLTITDDEGGRYYLNVKDEAFKLPKDCEGKKVVANGTLLSIRAQQEAAREKGLKASYIESISGISMEATGYYIE